MSDEANDPFLETYGPWAIVTGASYGVGAAWADAIAAKGLGVVMVARKEALLEDKASILRARGAEVRTLALDVLATDAIDRLRECTADLEVGLVVQNVGGVKRDHGLFLDDSLEAIEGVIAINALVTARLVYEYAPAMRLADAAASSSSDHCRAWRDNRPKLRTPLRKLSSRCSARRCGVSYAVTGSMWSASPSEGRALQALHRLSSASIQRPFQRQRKSSPRRSNTSRTDRCSCRSKRTAGSSTRSPASPAAKLPKRWSVSRCESLARTDSGRLVNAAWSKPTRPTFRLSPSPAHAVACRAHSSTTM